MLPTLRDGDLLLVDRAAVVARGRLVVATLPDGTTAVKRVTAWQERPPGWWVERDNPRDGVDSWTLGAIDAAAVTGVVRVRLWPPSRLRQGVGA